MTTITQAKEQFLAEYRGRIGLRGNAGRTPQSLNTLTYDLTRALEPIDGDLDICSLKGDDVKKVTNHWMRADNGLSARTAYNRITAFKQLLEWAADQDKPGYDCFTMPKGTAKLWAECRPKETSEIKPFNGDDLVKVLTTAPNDQVRLYILLGLNCGQYQQDISDLTPDNLQGEFLVWQRSKTAHQSNLTLKHWLWPETRRLIERCHKPNAFGRLLITTHGLPLVERRVDKRDRDAVTVAYIKVQAQAQVDVPFKLFRKWGATWIANKFGMDVQRVYRGETIKGSSKDYVLDDYERVTTALKAWHQELSTLLQQIA